MHKTEFKRQGNKNAIDSSNINMTSSSKANNIDIQKRGVQPDRVYNSIPQNIMCSETKPKNTLPNDPLANRLDPTMVDQFKKNPYTQSLKELCFCLKININLYQKNNLKFLH